MARGRTRKNFKKKRKTKGQSKVKKLLEINQRSLSKGQKQHLRDFGELHPADERSENDDLASKAKRPRRVEPVQRSEQESTLATNIKDDEQSESEDDFDAYQQLIGTLHKGSKTFVDLLIRKKREEAGKEEDDEDSENEKLQDNDKVDSREIIHEDQSDGNVSKNDSDVDDNLETHLECVHSNGSIYAKEEDPEEKQDVEECEMMDDDGDLNIGDEGSDDDDDDVTNSKASESAQQDPFKVHFEQDLEENIENKLQDPGAFQQQSVTVPVLGNVAVFTPQLDVPLSDIPVDENSTLSQLKVKTKLCQTWPDVNMISSDEKGQLTPLQQQLFQTMNQYKDIFFPNRNFNNGEEIRRLYCLHAVNHALKTRARVLKNNAKVVQAQKEKKEIGELRDQGLTRPKILIVVPFRDAALKIVEIITALLSADEKSQIMYKKRFQEEYSEPDGTDQRVGFQPDDFKAMFTGNIDDCFRIGMTVMRKGLKLYTEFYSSDIVLASPLGLRPIIGGKGEKVRDYDFLSSIEVLIVDQADVFLMQNWEHLQHIFNHLNLQPKDAHDVDFSRVRMWCLNGWSKYYRQTLIFSSFVFPEINSLFNKNCNNFAGKIKVTLGDIPGSIHQVVGQVPQVFHRIDCQSFSTSHDSRFEYFVEKVLPEFQSSLMSHTAIFISSYFDFLRIRNHFRKEGVDFLQISEYSTRSDISRARGRFFHSKTRFLLYTERFYFFYRYRIRGIRNIIFYGLPHYSLFYPEILNFLDTGEAQSEFGSGTGAATCTVLYTRFDTHRLARIVGTKRCKQMISSKKNIHLFVTGTEDN